MIKKFILASFVFVFVLLGVVSSASAVTTVTFEGNVTKFSSGVDATTVYIYGDDGVVDPFIMQKSATPSTDHYVQVYTSEYKLDVAPHDYKYVTSTTVADCSALAYSACVTAVTAGKITEGTYNVDFDFAELQANATAGFTGTVGFASSEVVTKVGTYLVKMLGGGLGLVNALIGWIIAIIVIMVIIRLIYHGLRFLHILK